MHIGLILEHLSASSGGAEGFALTVARELMQRGHRCSVCAADGGGLEGATVLLGPLASAPSRLQPLAPDVVVDWGLNAPADLHRLGGGTHREFQRLVLAAVPLPLRLAKRLLYAVSPRHRRIARREVGLLSRPGVQVLAVSRFVADQVARTLPFPAARLHVLHNGVDTRRFVAGGRPGVRAVERARLGLGEQDVAFLLVAHNLGLKGFGLLREVFTAGREQLPGARLVLLGRHDPGFRAPWFIYAGTSSRPEGAYAAADALLHPTLYDACANVVLEAMASGLPVVSSDRNGSAEVLTDGLDGRVLPVLGRHREIRTRWLQAVAELATRPERRQDLGAQARRRAESLSIGAYVDRFEALLQQVAAERPRGG
jgi:UDP-glucose:(heptosyl)LPS alpha-1,3-glucosyltransferase